MVLIPVNSSSLRAVGYERGVLAVRFRTSDRIYVHFGVPYSIHAALMRATSKGAYYNQHVRGKFK